MNMKRALALLLALLLLTPAALAEDLDLSSMTFEELCALKQRINDEIVTRPEWRGVAVPKGFYTIGQDIPAGVYSVSLQDNRDTCFVGVWGHAVNDYTTNGGLICSFLLRPGSPSVGRVVLREGYVLELGNPVTLRHAEGLDF